MILLPALAYGKSKNHFLSKELASWVPTGTRAPQKGLRSQQGGLPLPVVLLAPWQGLPAAWQGW